MTVQSATQLPRRLKVFLCHGSGDKPAVRELYHRLRSAGFDKHVARPFQGRPTR